VIRTKTWSPVAHIEIALGDGRSYASRNGVGVNTWALRREGLAAILRPKGALSLVLAQAYERATQGQKYDFVGLMCFILAANKGSPDRMFCSEAARNWYRSAGFEPFSPQWSSDKVSPGMFLQSPLFDWVWTNGFKV
jgi:hypothetical protein